VRLLAADAIDSLPAVLFKELPGVAAQAAALRLPLDVAAALGDTEAERAAADVLASQSASLEAANAELAAVQTPEEFARAREALARAPAQSPSDAAPYAAREHEADAVLRAATTITAFRLAQVRQLIVRKILFSRFDALVRGAGVSDAFARLFSGQRLEEFKLAQAESATRFALRHNGQEPTDRLLGATRALAAAITAVVAESAERDKLDCAVENLFADASAMSISPQAVTLSACLAESGATTSAASSGSSAGASRAGERRRCACPGCPNGGSSKCSACKSVEYCGRTCQKLHWAAHKAACKTSPGSKT
jgi:hypothetical protein